ncbi:MAG: hypothetical protein COA98_07025, partial [Candidatus Neomarinimicrobiota bacterium]
YLDVTKLKNMGFVQKYTIWEGLDILINNAGIVAAGPLEDIQDEDLYDQVAVNLTAVMLLTKYCIPLLKSSCGQCSDVKL